jgi:hypothetical protein
LAAEEDLMWHIEIHVPEDVDSVAAWGEKTIKYGQKYLNWRYDEVAQDANYVKFVLAQTKPSDLMEDFRDYLIAVRRLRVMGSVYNDPPVHWKGKGKGQSKRAGQQAASSTQMPTTEDGPAAEDQEDFEVLTESGALAGLVAAARDQSSRWTAEEREIMRQVLMEEMEPGTMAEEQ